jgi:FtsP/CotA-like multicopper oxidase with cupredoxin domain
MTARTRSRGRRLAIGLAALLLGGGLWAWATSLLPSSYAMTSMGYADYGGGPAPASGSAAHPPPSGGIDITGLVPDTRRPADVRVELVARAARIAIPGVPAFEGYTLNGGTPGPTIRAREGDLVEVRVVNDNVRDGMTLHWHGVDLPNAMDGVAGVTQDAIRPGHEYVYRFVAQAGSYWYHSHQLSHPQVSGGLLGALVVDPRQPAREVLDVAALVHFYGGVRTINGQVREDRHPATPGTTARVRVINTDPGPMPVWVSGARYRVVAVDGRDLNRPEPITGEAVLVTAGGRADLELVVPPGGARVEFAGASVVLGDPGAPFEPAPRRFVDFLRYGSPAAVGFDPERPIRSFDYLIGRGFGLIDGRPGSWWTINGGLYPNVPMFVVRTGEVVRFRVSNSSGEVHPMHLHGHHLLVLSRDGVPATGSPWLVDSLNVNAGETYELALLADNPGIWMDHCHNLPHAREGLMTHLTYEGYTTPLLVGGEHANHPE